MAAAQPLRRLWRNLRTGDSPRDPQLADVFERLRVIILSGVTLGVLVGGVGGRLAMFVLRLTSPDTVRGVISDDGFEIGRVTLGGSYGLCLIAAAIGLIGAAVYGLVAPWLIGPAWFRRSTCALGAGAVVGSMLVHADGVDFTLLKPTWLAIALFVALPAVFGALIGDVRTFYERSDSWVNAGPRRWLLPIVAVVCFPLTIFFVLLITLALFVLLPVRSSLRLRQLRAIAAFRFATRTVWCVIAGAGLASLIGDVDQII
jgi:hypothetical protein